MKNNEKKQKELESYEKFNMKKKREKYWQIIRDLHAPKISDLKKQEMEHLIQRTVNKRLLIDKSQSKNKLQQNKSMDYKSLGHTSGPENPMNSNKYNLIGKIKRRRRKNTKRKSVVNTHEQSKSNLKYNSFDYLQYMRNKREQENPQEDGDQMVWL